LFVCLTSLRGHRPYFSDKHSLYNTAVAPQQALQVFVTALMHQNI